MAAREAARPLQRLWMARGRPASLPSSYTTTGDVIALGRELGLPDAFVKRHPFPGPGLAIRMPGAIYLKELHNNGIYEDIWQAFAVLLPVQSAGVIGGARTYRHVLALRAVTSAGGMTAGFYRFPPGLPAQIATRIVNEVKGVNRVA